MHRSARINFRECRQCLVVPQRCQPHSTEKARPKRTNSSVQPICEIQLHYFDVLFVVMSFVSALVRGMWNAARTKQN